MKGYLLRIYFADGDEVAVRKHLFEAATLPAAYQDAVDHFESLTQDYKPEGAWKLLDWTVTQAMLCECCGQILEEPERESRSGLALEKSEQAPGARNEVWRNDKEKRRCHKRGLAH